MSGRPSRWSSLHHSRDAGPGTYDGPRAQKTASSGQRPGVLTEPEPQGGGRGQSRSVTWLLQCRCCRFWPARQVGQSSTPLRLLPCLCLQSFPQQLQDFIQLAHDATEASLDAGILPVILIIMTETARANIVALACRPVPARDSRVASAAYTVLAISTRIGVHEPRHEIHTTFSAPPCTLGKVCLSPVLCVVCIVWCVVCEDAADEFGFGERGGGGNPLPNSNPKKRQQMTKTKESDPGGGEEGGGEGGQTQTPNLLLVWERGVGRELTTSSSPNPTLLPSFIFLFFSFFTFSIFFIFSSFEIYFSFFFQIFFFCSFFHFLFFLVVGSVTVRTALRQIETRSVHVPSGTFHEQEPKTHQST